MAENTLYYGDNLDVLRRYVKDESVDLVYLDPPFNSNADYNVLFAEQDGTRAAAQIKAFGDTWRWDQAAYGAYHELVEGGPSRVSQAMLAFHTLLGESNMLAYLAMMAPRLVELHRVLKPTGSIYLHCDPTASHYLKILMDGVFGAENFRSEIVWKRSTSHGNVSRNYGDLYDSLFFYSKGRDYVWNQQYRPFSEEYIEDKFGKVDENGRRFQDVTLRNPGVRPNLHFPFTASNGVTYQPHPNGWACDRERLQKYDREGRLYFPRKAGGQLRLKMYLDESLGTRLQNLWDDIPAINSRAAERLGYPTQKPEALLERIVSTSSNEGDVVLDPFCGCGTAVAVAHRLRRQWIGIDITHLAITLIKSRLQDAYGPNVAKAYKVVGEPVSLPDAYALAHESDRYQFQYWALGLVGARPLQTDQKKGADKGIDGRLYFHDDAETGATKQIVFSVKSGHLKADDIRALGHVVQRENAQIGVLISMEQATAKMRADAMSAGFYNSPWGTKHPKLQILTVGDLLNGARVDMPPSLDMRTFKKAPKAKKKSDTTAPELAFGDDDE